MLSGNKNLKDTTTNKGISLLDTSFAVSYTKTHKLIAALYMVTDIIDKDEPIRNKLRILGTEVISDMHSSPADVGNKIAEIVSFLNIASTMSFISEMNCNVLKNEFFELKRSVHEFANAKPKWLEEFFPNPVLDSNGHAEQSKGHIFSNSIGVQKGSTLLKALSDRTKLFSPSISFSNTKNNFLKLKKDRRDNIINIIKNNGGSASIKDIRTKINNKTNGGLSYSEKTLQRELLSLTKDNVLNKTGEKRWSKYFIKN